MGQDEYDKYEETILYSSSRFEKITASYSEDKVYLECPERNTNDGCGYPRCRGVAIPNEEFKKLIKAVMQDIPNLANNAMKIDTIFNEKKFLEFLFRFYLELKTSNEPYYAVEFLTVLAAKNGIELSKSWK